jgi:ABC-2 type transport system permease protein
MAYAAVALVAVPVMLASYREKGILRQFKIAKLPMWKISVSILLSQLLFMLIQTAVVIVFGCLLLGAHFNFSTSSTLVIPALLLGLFSMLAVGFALGAFLPNSRAATMTGNMVNLVAIFLGGVFFPVDTWPGYIRPLTFINPLTWIVEGLRKATLYGTMNLTTAGIEMAILAILGVIATAITLKFFRYE